MGVRVESLGEPGEAMLLRNVATPEPADDTVLLKVCGAALGFPDVLMVRGRYQAHPDLPFVPGAEVCGEIVTGRPPDWYEPGSRVAGLLTSGTGGLAQYAVASRQYLYPVPEALGDAEGAALVSAFGTAWCGLKPLVSRVAPMTSAAGEPQAVGDGRTVGRVVIDPWTFER